MMSEYSWEALSAEAFEQLCAVLISRIHPEVRRVEASGLERGFDFLIPTATGSILYQCKSYYGSLTSSRRRQIEQVLTRAEVLEPKQFNLVVPLDPANSDARWFAKVTSAFDFECRILGRVWLDAQLDALPDVRNYYLRGARDELAPTLQELLREQGMAGRRSNIDREQVVRLAQRLSSIDPQYAFAASIDVSGAPSLSIWPKYPGAEYDRPLNVRKNSSQRLARGNSPSAEEIEDTGRGRLQSYVKEVRSHLPEPLIEMLWGSDESQSTKSFVRVLKESGLTAAQLPLIVESREVEERIATALLWDVTHSFSVKIIADLDSQTVKCTFKYALPEPAIPAQIIPALKLLMECRPPNSVSVIIDGSEVGPPMKLEEPLGPEQTGYEAVVQDLGEIQQLSGVYFFLPANLTARELDEIKTARRLLNGEEVSKDWSELKMTTTVGALASLNSTLERGPGTLAVDAELTLTIDGEHIPLGMTRRIMPSFVIAEWPELEDDLAPETPVDIVLVPGPDRSATTVLLPDGMSDAEDGKVRFKKDVV
jgi:hypothetical protein